MAHVCSSFRYLQTCADESLDRHAWPALLSSGFAQPLLTMGDPWVPPSVPSGAPTPSEDPDFKAEEEED